MTDKNDSETKGPERVYIGRDCDLNKHVYPSIEVAEKWSRVSVEEYIRADLYTQSQRELEESRRDHTERDRYRELLARMHDDTILDKQDAEYYKRIIKVHREWITEAISPIPELRQSLPHEWHSGCAYATPKKL